MFNVGIKLSNAALWKLLIRVQMQMKTAPGPCARFSTEVELAAGNRPWEVLAFVEGHIEIGCCCIRLMLLKNDLQHIHLWISTSLQEWICHVFFPHSLSAKNGSREMEKFTELPIFLQSAGGKTSKVIQESWIVVGHLLHIQFKKLKTFFIGYLSASPFW